MSTQVNKKGDAEQRLFCLPIKRFIRWIVYRT